MIFNNKAILLHLTLSTVLSIQQTAFTIEEPIVDKKEQLLEQLHRLEGTTTANKELIQAIQKELKDLEEKSQIHPVISTKTLCEDNTSKQDAPAPQLKESLELLENEFANFGKVTSSEELLEAQDQIILNAVLLFIQTKIDYIKFVLGDQHKNAIEDAINQQLDVLSLFCFVQKSILAKLELLSIGSNVSTKSPITEPLSYSQIWHIYIQVLNELYQQLSAHWYELRQNALSLETLRKTFFSNTHITKLIIQNLPQPLRYTLGAKYLTVSGKRLSHLYKLLDYNANEDIPILYKTYKEIMQQYRTHTTSQDLPSFLGKLIITLGAFEQKRQEYKEQQATNQQEAIHLKYAIEVIELFIANLLFIKQEQTKLETWNKTCTQNPNKVSFWLKHQEIMGDPTITLLCKNSPLFNICFLQYNKVVVMFFNGQEQLLEFIYLLLLTTAQIKSISNPQPAANDFLFNFTKNYLPSFITSFIKNTANTSLPQKMDTLLNEIMNYLLKTAQKKTTTHLVLSELSKENAKNSQQNESFLKATQQLVDNNMGSIKKGLLFLFNNLSPYIAIALITWVFPKLSEEIKTKFTKFFEQQQTSPAEKKSSLDISNFIATNPDILDALSKLYPDLMQKLTEQQKTAPPTVIPN